MAGTSFGEWSPLDVPATVELFRGSSFRWWLSGGRALALHLGRSWRPHDDTDVGVLREELGAVRAALGGWELHLASRGHLVPWAGEPLRAEDHQNNVWLRRDGGPWLLDLTIGEGDASTWVYRRDPRLRVPMGEAVLETAGGVPYLAPELQLLFKSKDPRPKDDVDAAAVIPALDEARRDRLAALLPGDHPWQRLIATTASA